ncbi:MAG: hypothetical protein Q9159_006791 [Coniocarpon cinnabarinum]
MSRPRAPTITIDTSATTPATDNIPLATSPGMLDVPGVGPSLGSRGSFDSQSGTYVGTPSSRSRSASSNSFESSSDLLNDPDALKPNRGDDASFHVENNPFGVSPGQLSKLLDPKSYSALYALHGASGLEKSLHTNLTRGLDAHETLIGSSKEGGRPFDDRIRVFLDNRLPEKQSKSLLKLIWMAASDKVLIILIVAGVVSLAIGLYQGTKGEGPEWIEGVAIIVAVTIVVLVTALNDFQREKQFKALNKRKDDFAVKVKRSAEVLEIPVHDILVGDVLLIEQGNVVPADGIFLSGHNVACDESATTGESDVLGKTPAASVIDAMANHRSLKKLDPFMISGSTVEQGVGEYLVTATGRNSCHGRVVMSLQDEGETTPLQAKLNVITEQIAWAAAGATLLYFVVVFIRFLVQITHGSWKIWSPDEKGNTFLNLFLTSVSLVAVAIPEGLPLSVTLALAFATKRMLKDNNLVRMLRSCETMGNATTVCSDKTGTLTQNEMTVVAGTIWQSNCGRDGIHFGKNDDMIERIEAETYKSTRELLMSSVTRNTTAWEAPAEDGSDLMGNFKGSKTETALLSFMRKWFSMRLLKEEQVEGEECVWFVPFDSAKKMSAAVLRNGSNYRILMKGAPEMMLQHCVSMPYDENYDAAAANVRRLIDEYASGSLRTIGMAYRDVSAWPPAELHRREPSLEELCHDLTFFALVGIQDPLRPGAANAVATCRRAGVFPRMVTGDNKLTAIAIAKECGILTDGIAMEGPEFRNLPINELDEILPRLQVLARSGPEDKRRLVKRLKELGETVAVTGDGTNDAPALKVADIGFAMGLKGTGVAKEASDIILLDDNFSSIVRAIEWGRAVNDAVKKFLQFQLTVNITAVITTVVTGIASINQTTVLTAVQLLWVNLIMDTLAALALATDPPSKSVLDRRPDKKSDPIISVTMWKMLLIQAVYQLIFILLCYFVPSLLPYSEDVHRTTIFNAFVWMQIFNTLNCRRLDNKFNVFEGIFKNLWYPIILVVMIAGQILIVFVGGAALTTVRINGAQWGISLIAGAVVLPLGVLARCIPDAWVLKLIPPRVKKFVADRARRQEEAQRAKELEEQRRRFEWNEGMEGVRRDLQFLKVKGGRLARVSAMAKRPRRGRSRRAMAPAAVAAGIVAGSIGGWSPVGTRPSSRTK